MNIIQVISHQVLLYKFDEIPFQKIRQKLKVMELAAMFNFSDIQLTENGQSIVLNSGNYKDEYGDYAIGRLVIEERRILIDLIGGSEKADSIISSLTTFLSNITGRADINFMVPIIKAEESEIISRLDFHAANLFSPQLLNFLENSAKPAFDKSMAKSVIKPTGIQCLVQYQADSLFLDDYLVALSRKEFTLGPRPGYPINDQIYYSKAPVSSETHIELLRTLEAKFGENLVV